MTEPSPTANSLKSGRRSVELLLNGIYARPFLGLVVAVRIGVPGVLLWVAGSTYFASLLAAVAILAGFFAYRVLIFKAALYEPIVSFKG